MEFIFGNLVFFSNFDSGNLNQVQKVDKLETESNSAFDLEFNLWTKPDAAGTAHENLNRSWFYFGVKHVLPFSSGVIIKMNIMNLNKQCKLYNGGYVPFFKVGIRGKWERIKEKITFEPSGTDHILTFQHTFQDFSTATYFAFSYPWSYTECQEKLSALDRKFISCSDFGSHSLPNSIYYHRELLCYTLDGFRVDLLSVSDCSGISDAEEPRFDEKLFPDKSYPRCKEFPTKKVFFLSSRVHPGETPSSHVFNGFLDFILKQGDARAEELRRKFVFKLIPMLNPDGVSRGYYRTDQFGVNLNRVYLDPTFELYPSIYATKSLLVFHHCRGMSAAGSRFQHQSVEQSSSLQNQVLLAQEKAEEMDISSTSTTEPQVSTLSNSPTQSLSPSHNPSSAQPSHLFKTSPTKIQTSSLPPIKCDEDNIKPLTLVAMSDPVLSSTTPHLSDPKLLNINPKDSGIAFYVDLHAHASKKGCFFYGNNFTNLENQAECLTYAKLVSMNSGHFDFGQCNFTEKNMYATDKRENSSKEGSGRVAIFKHLGIVHSYTLECNYNTGRVVNHICPTTGDKGRASPPPPAASVPPKYTMAHFEGVGRAVAIAALDLTGSNPWSRLTQSEFVDANGVREFLLRTHPLLKKIGKTSSTSLTPVPSLSPRSSCLNQSKEMMTTPGAASGGHVNRNSFSLANSTVSGGGVIRKTSPMKKNSTTVSLPHHLNVARHQQSPLKGNTASTSSQKGSSSGGASLHPRTSQNLQNTSTRTISKNQPERQSARKT